MFKKPRTEEQKPAEQTDFRSEGDKARDQRNWLQAEAMYKSHLEAVPGDTAIWVQLGHALKEHGKLAEAETAYRQATQLLPDDSDAYLHLAYMLKHRDRDADAAAMFLEVMRIAPSNAAYLELLGLGYARDAERAARLAPAAHEAHGRYIELVDFFDYIDHHSTLTGISRVVLNLLNYLFGMLEPEQAAQYHFVHQFEGGDSLMLIPREGVRELVALLNQPRPDHDTIKDKVSSLKRDALLAMPKSGDLYFMPGAFWNAAQNPNFLPNLNSRGVLVSAYIYDLIPITHAHYCMEALTAVFTMAFAECAPCFDFVLTISDYVAQEVGRFMQGAGMQAFPIHPVPLAHELKFETNATAHALPVLPKNGNVGQRPYVLCVCTIEARKNHIYLFYLWQEMINAGIDVPDLVFVGREGWRVSDLLGQIAATRCLDGRLHILSGISDAELAGLYDNCLFTVFPSFVEGWGLPVGESLAHGKVCVASNVTSIPEVGGELVAYIDPFNLHSGKDVILKLIQDPAYLKQCEDNIRQNFVARSWQQVGKSFFGQIDRAVAAAHQSGQHHVRLWPKLESSKLLEFQNLLSSAVNYRRYVTNPVKLIFAEGWRSVEAAGTWMQDRQATVRFQSDLPEHTEIMVLLRLQCSCWLRKGGVLRIAVGQSLAPTGDGAGIASCELAPDASFWTKAVGKVGADGLVSIHLDLDAQIKAKPKNLPVALQLCSIGYAPAGDADARLSLIESVESAVLDRVREREDA